MDAFEQAIREAISDRDMEWWQATALVDNVAPTPEAVKCWLAVEQQYHIERAVAAERERCAKIVEATPSVTYYGGDVPGQDGDQMLKDAAAAIREGKE